MTTVFIKDLHDGANSKVKTLFVEDCPVMGEIIPEFVKDEHPDMELVLTSTRKEAVRILNTQNDFDFVFLDWNLPDGTSQGLAKLALETQVSVIEIIGMSGDPDMRRIQMAEGATSECEKSDAIWKLGEFRKKYGI